MPPEITSERLADLLVDLREDLDLEVKNWLDLQDNNNDKAIFDPAPREEDLSLTKVENTKGCPLVGDGVNNSIVTKHYFYFMAKVF